MKNRIVLTARGVLRRVSTMLLAVVMVFPASVAVAEDVSPGDFFPSSNIPQAVRERLANRLLGKQRITDPAFGDYYRRIAKELAPDDDYLIVTAANDAVNAFAHYGGLIVMMRGMWKFAQNEDAFVGIVAHEMSHIKLDHFEKLRKLNDTVTVLSVPLIIAGLLTDSPEVRESIIVGGTGIITGQIYGYSRELEHEADVSGLQLLSATGRDGRQMASLLGRFNSSGSEYVSTHPAPRRRAAYIQDRLRGAPSPIGGGDSLDFLLLRQILAVSERVSSDFIRKQKRKLAAAGGKAKTALQFGLLLAADKTRNKAEAKNALEKLAQNKHPFIVAAMADYISRAGEHKKALAMVAAARVEHPESAALAVRHIELLRRAGEHRELEEVREDMPESQGERSDVLREASQSASALGEKVRSNLLLAQSHLHQGEFELALRQLDIAAKYKMSTKLLVLSNALKQKIDHELEALGSTG